MFTADGLRPDSPHLMPPRGAACVLSLSFSPAPRVSVPLQLGALSLVLTPFFCCSLTPIRPCLSYSCRPFHVHGTLVVVSCFVPRVSSSPHRPCSRHDYPAASAKAGNSDCGSKSVLAEGRGLIPERDSDIMEHEKGTETTSFPTRTHARARAHDRLNTYTRRIYMQGRC